MPRMDEPVDAGQNLEVKAPASPKLRTAAAQQIQGTTGPRTYNLRTGDSDDVKATVTIHDNSSLARVVEMVKRRAYHVQQV